MTMRRALAWVTAAALSAAVVGAQQNWAQVGQDSGATKYSTLDQINTGNVKTLQRAWTFHTGDKSGFFESTPLMIDGTLYVTTATNTYAIDARTGEQRWVHHFEPKSLGIGTPVRGVGYGGGRLFRGTPDGHLLALDARTGKVIWDVIGTDATIGEYYTAAPTAALRGSRSLRLPKQ